MVQLGKEMTGRLARRTPQVAAGGGVNTTMMAPAALRGPGAVAPAAKQGTVANASSLEGLVQKKLLGRFSSDPGIRFGDGSFYLPTIAEVQAILQDSQLQRRTWMAERFDCDDFAYCLKGEMSSYAYDTGDLAFGLCLGIVWGNFSWVNGYHAVNWFIAPDQEIRFIEPQSDDIHDASHCQGQISLLLA